MIYTLTLNPAIDKIKYLESDLQQEQNNRVQKKLTDLGGKATHVSAVLQQLNQQNIALGFVGTLNKQEFYEVLEIYNVQHEYIEIKDETTRETIVVINNSGGSYMITEKGPNILQEDKDKLYETLKKHVKETDIVVIAGSNPPSYSLEDFKELLRVLKRNNPYIACDVAGDYLKISLEENVDFVKPNEHELDMLYPGNESIRQKFTKLSEKVKNAVCSLGAEGAMYMVGGKIHQIKPPNVKVLSDTGAGDSFVGGYVYGLHQKYSIDDCVKQGIIVSASKVQHYGSCRINPTQFDYINKNIKTLEVR